MTVTLAGSSTEETFAEVLADLVGVDRVPADSHFFDDLGADSLVMAQFCARVRKRDDLPQVSMKDVYAQPTLGGLAASLTDDDDATIVEAPVPAAVEAPTPGRTPQYVLCGALQLLALLGYLYGAALAVAAGYEWISAGSGAIEVYLRSVTFGAAAFLGMCALPILAKWMLVGRWTRRRIPVWSLAYVRFWIVKALVQRNPLALFAGTPLYALYLRALGAKVGRDVLILSRRVPVCTDLLTIGDGTVIRKDSFFTCYRAQGGLIEPGAVTLGNDVVVGEAAVLDIETSMGDRAQLGHASSLHAGQAVPAGERRQGSPAEQRTEVDYRAFEQAGCGPARKVVYSALQLLRLLALTLPLAIGAVAMLITEVPRLASLVESGPPAFTSWTFYADALAVSFVLLFGSMLVGFVFVMSVPRVLNRFIEPDTVYRLYGFHYGVHRAIERMTNVPFFPRVLGDSSYIVPYLSWLGYDLSEVEQTGSNFGLEVKHENPYLCSIGTGTMVADGLSMINADFSSTSFRVSRTAIGAHNFLGNYIAYPPQGRTGDNCLIATKADVPLDGEVREDIGLLGSPSFEIPRSVHRDSRFDHLERGDERRRRLAAKNRHNAVSIGLFLLALWIFLFGATVLTWVAADLYGSIGAAAIALAGLLVLVLRVVHFSLVERLATMFRDLRPLYCSIYERDFWAHERFWKLAWQPLILDGTPFKSLTWRLLGVRIGKRVFDDGCAIVEKTLVTIGDDCTLSIRSVVQPHSQEDGAFKSDRIAIGAGCTLGIGSLVHYGTTMGDGAVLDPDSFLMKGEEVPAHARWAGNPATSRT
ncbi:MAG TPA: Pls/PosA family non-ribosomal peptide synthetase [Thermoleophilaceae bacterium]|nr:Pls/PosA family non-ribosomal peptide synthetase [Thermoleophilaceae bacterium]